MRKIAAVFLFFATPVLAQQQPPTVQQELDGAVATVTRTVTGLTNALAQDAMQIDRMRAQIAALQKQVDALTKERDDPKAAAQPAK